MNVYVVIKRGIYRHEVVGVWQDLHVARAAAEAAIAAEPDDWHSFPIVETPLGTLGEDKVVCELHRWRATSNPDQRRYPGSVDAQLVEGYWQWWEESSHAGR